MALKEEDIQNCDDIKEYIDVLIAKVVKECPPSLNKPTENVICSDLFAQKDDAVTEKPHASFSRDIKFGETEVVKEFFPSECNVEACQQEGKSSVNLTTHIRNEESSQTNDPTFDLSETSSTGGQTIKCDPEIEIKINRKETCLPSSSHADHASPSAPSKQKLRNTKRRAGILYKKLTSSKLCNVTSKYFSHAHKNNEKRWIPPRSPYALVQEDLFDNPWQLLVATVFLTKTTAKKALPQLHKFLARYSRPEDVLKASYDDIDEFFRPLGLTTTRSHIIMRFTVEFLEKDWTYPRELYGIGKYGDDSYRMFCINEWRQVSPDDIPLSMYRNWLLENAQRLGVE